MEKIDRVRMLAIDYAWSFLGKWYLWGGDDPMSGFDCSGLVMEVLQAVGLVDRGSDMTAAGLWHHFQEQRVEKPYEGCLVFYRSLTREKIVHIELCLDEDFAIGASGGGSWVKTIEDAKKSNAFIKIRRIDSRKGIVGYVDPFLAIKQ